MTVECPGCSTTFPVDPKKVPAGGVHARCSVCGEVFFVDEPASARAPAVAAPVAAADATAPVEAEVSLDSPADDEGVTATMPPTDEAREEEDGGLPGPAFVPPTQEPLEDAADTVPMELAEESEPFDQGEEPLGGAGGSAPLEAQEPEGDQAAGPGEIPTTAPSPERLAEELVEAEGWSEAIVTEDPRQPWGEAEPEIELGETAEEETDLEEVMIEDRPGEVAVTEAMGNEAFREELPTLEEADAEGDFRVEVTPAEEELPFVAEVTPEGELAPDTSPEEELGHPEGGEPRFRMEEPTFGEGELVFTMDGPILGGETVDEETSDLSSAVPAQEEEDESPADAGWAEPPAEEPAAPTAPLPPPPTPQFGRRDPREKAQRLARVLVSDIILYNPDRHQRALEQGRLKEEFEDEIQKSWNEYVEQVGEEIAEGTEFFNDALNEILAKGRKTF